jgi:hypothetical protein
MFRISSLLWQCIILLLKIHYLLRNSRIFSFTDLNFHISVHQKDQHFEAGYVACGMERVKHASFCVAEFVYVHMSADGHIPYVR